jgi:hypothetical protein
VPVHPMQARPSRDQTIRRIQRRLLGRGVNPADVGRIAFWQRPRELEHWPGEIDSVDAINKLAQPARNRPIARAEIAAAVQSAAGAWETIPPNKAADAGRRTPPTRPETATRTRVTDAEASEAGQTSHD